MKKISLLIILLFQTLLSAQYLPEFPNTDSLFNRYVKLHFSERYNATQNGNLNIEKEEYHKCALGLHNSIRENYSSFSEEQKSILKIFLSRPQLHASIVSPSGFFRIHFDTSGVNKPNYVPELSLEQNLAEVALAFDSSYNFEVNKLGFLTPRGDNGQGGDDKYAIYIINISDYGYTDYEGSNISYAVIDNDYTIHKTAGLDGMRVTAAHEFHHGIQLGNYVNSIREADRYYYEITSVAMEEFVYDSINDYYYYMPGYFNNPQRSFNRTAGRGYDLGIWHIYLKDRFGINIVKEIWEGMSNTSAIESLSKVLINYGSSLKDEFNKFGLWNYFSGNRAKQGKYFEEAAFYPSIKPMSIFNFTPPLNSYQIATEPIVNNYLIFANTQTLDTLTAIITHSDNNAAVSTPALTSPFGLELFTYAESGSNRIIGDYHSKLTTSTEDKYFQSYVFNNEEVSNPDFFREELDYAFPNPFYYSKNEFIFLPASITSEENVELSIYSVDMNLIYSGSKLINRSNEKVTIPWDGLDNKGSQIPSGIYLFVTKSGDSIKKGKLVIYND